MKRLQEYRPLVFGASVALFCVYLWVELVIGNSIKILPFVSINTTRIGGLTPQEAQTRLEDVYNPEKVRISFVIEVDGVASDSAIATMSAKELGLSYPIDHSVTKAYQLGRSGYFLRRIREIFQKSHTISLQPEWDRERLDTVVDSLLHQYEQPYTPYSVSLGKSGYFSTLEIEAGTFGTTSDLLKTTESIMQAVAHLDLDTTDMHIPLAYHAHTPLTSEEYKTLQENATYFVGKSPELIISNKHASISDQEMISFLHPRGGLNGEILSHYIEELKKNIDQNPVEPVLEIEQNIVVTFIPPEDGISLHSTQAVLELQSALEKMVSEKPKTLDAITLSFQSTPPTRPLESTNTLGIKEVIGTGESYFHHSIPNRVHNVKLTFDRIQHALILPGETFSFNATAGEISSRTGFKPAYVISKGQTVLGDGGGVCQVSTTVFRATLDAGLPIVKRKGHSYRVSYYEENSKPGFDATVYAPSTDFQFVNDTAHAILLRSFVDTELLYARVEFWGTQDGRVAEIQNYKQWGASRPLATRYVDDPTLPAGKLRQIDWSAPGLKTSFEYVVKKPNSDGNLEESRQVFSTVYQPWAAVYLRGTGN